jgi:arabinose-5-phosphate isomerase
MVQEPSPQQVLAIGKAVLAQETQALSALSQALDDSFSRAVGLLLACRGRVIVCGLGKSGHIGKKIAASLASLGTPSFFLHAVEAVHGDLGMITAQDVVILLSHSGKTDEMVALLDHLKGIGCSLLAITGNPASPLAQAAAVHLDTGVRCEADSRGLAPTTSALLTLALGDALALTLADLRGFSRQDFLRLHPGGSLGRLKK